MSRRSGDRGAVLILALIVVVVLGATVAALATYATTSLRFGSVGRAGDQRRLAADGALRAALDQIEAGTASCLYDQGASGMPGIALSINGITLGDDSLTCESIDAPFDSPRVWAAAFTGAEALPTSDEPLDIDTAEVTISGLTYMPTLVAGEIGQIDRAVALGAPLIHGGGCTDALTPGDVAGAFDFAIDHVDRPVCTNLPWQQLPSLHAPPVPTYLASMPPAPVPKVYPNCTVYFPGLYDTDLGTPAPGIPDISGSAYFVNGEYVFVSPSNADFRVRSGAHVHVGKSSTATPHDPNCASTPEYTGDSDEGATVYLGGRARINVTGGMLELTARQLTDGTRTVETSIYALCAASTWCDGPGGQPESLHRYPIGGSNLNIVRVIDDGLLVLDGLLYAPLAHMRLDTDQLTELRGGVVIGRLAIDDSGDVEIGTPEGSTSPSRVVVTAAATSNGATTAMQSAIAYDPAAAAGSRTVVRSWHVCDTAC